MYVYKNNSILSENLTEKVLTKVGKSGIIGPQYKLNFQIKYMILKDLMGNLKSKSSWGRYNAQ